jgi:hypothetical protein
LAGLFCFLAALGGAVFPRAQADDKKDQGQKQADAKGAKAPHAATVDFSGSLGLSLEGLKSLGERIDKARADADPVSLALAAKELSVAEQVSGKKASITADTLLKEAVDLAKMRSEFAELKAVALLADDASKKDLTTLAEKVGADIEKRKASEGKPGEKTKGIKQYVTVVNHTAWYIDVYVNGRFRGTVDPYDDIEIFVGDRYSDTTVLYAKAPGTDIVWGPRGISRGYDTFTWDLYN